MKQIIFQILIGLSLIPWFMLLFLSAFMFDDPHGSNIRIPIFLFILSYPILAIVSIVMIHKHHSISWALLPFAHAILVFLMLKAMFYIGAKEKQAQYDKSRIEQEQHTATHE
jgi:hypothetical protein